MKRLLLVLIFFLILVTPQAYAQTQIPMPSLTPTATPTDEPFRYELPYPGVLPGTFLYNLKVLRDKITEILISDSVKKSDFYLLQADKRLAASLMLFEKGDHVLAETTLSKGQNYLEKSLEKAIKAREEEADANEITTRIKSSAVKQKQEIEKLIKRARGETVQKLKGDLKRAEELEKRVDQFKSE